MAFTASTCKVLLIGYLKLSGFDESRQTYICFARA